MRPEETRKAYKGNADRPIEQASQDEFDVSPYVEGLGDFTLDCETPLTIAVQGAWGSGKTSMMNMLQKYLEETGRVEKAERNEYISLIRMTTDGNPRSIKRIANYYKLTDKVAVSKGIYDEFEDDETAICRKIALAFACIELRYPDFYEYLMSRWSAFSACPP